MDLLNLSRPWDCESFPKSKTICYGGGGGGGGGNPIKKISDTVSDATPTIKVDTPKITTPKVTVPKITTPKIVTPKVELPKITPPKIVTPKVELPKITPPKITVPKITTPKVLTDIAEGVQKKATLASKGASSTIESVKKDVAQSDIGKATSAGIENIKKEGSKVIEHTKGEIGKLASGEFSLKKAITGTASGASKTFKESDLGVVTKKIAKETGYTGSDFDKTMQKAESETSNVVNQTLDFVDSPGKVILSNVKKADQYIKRQMGVNVPTGQELLAQGIVSVGKLLQKKPTETKAGPGGAVTIGGGTGPGSGKTLGSGKVQGLQGGAAMDTSRARVRQNKRKLRIS